MSLGSSDSNNRSTPTYGVTRTPYSRWYINQGYSTPEQDAQRYWQQQAPGQGQSGGVGGGTNNPGQGGGFVSGQPWNKQSAAPSQDPNAGMLILDPSIHGLQDDALNRNLVSYGDIGSQYNDFSSKISDMRSRFLGSQGSIMDSYMQPAMQASQRARESMSMRGMSGSSFYDQTEMNSARNEANAGSMAQNQMISTELGLNNAQQAAFNSAIEQRMKLTGESFAVARDRLSQEIQSFNLGKSQATQGHGSGFNAGFTMGGSVSSSSGA